MRESHPAGVDVALLIDFGNLVRGVVNDVDCEALFRFAGEHGRVAAANAYADWSAEEVCRYQAALRGLGVEPVQVPGPSDGSHGVCIRMAVDAVELMWSAPQVGVYVIVAADGGLFPAVKALQRHGRKVVGVWPGRRQFVVRGSQRSGRRRKDRESLRLRREDAVSDVCSASHRR